MAPVLLASGAAVGGSQLVAQSGDSRGAPLKDWKELIDNGLVSGGGHAARQNRTAATEDPSPSRAPGSVSNLIPLYCGLLGALICGLVLWIVLKHARRRGGRDSKLQPPSAAVGCDAASSAPLAPGRRAAEAEAAGAAEAEVDSEVGDDVIGRRRLGELSEPRMKRLEQLLDRGSCWKALADELGYKADDVAEFESRAQLDSASAAGLLLRHWEASVPGVTGTVGDLRRRLQAAGLVDALPCLRDSTAAAERKRRHRQAAGAPQVPVGVVAADTDAAGHCQQPLELTTV